MKLYTTIAALLIAAAMIPGCATVRSYATCENAQIAIETAQRAADALCRFEAPPTPES